MKIIKKIILALLIIYCSLNIYSQNWIEVANEISQITVDVRMSASYEPQSIYLQKANTNVLFWVSDPGQRLFQVKISIDNGVTWTNYGNIADSRMISYQFPSQEGQYKVKCKYSTILGGTQKDLAYSLDVFIVPTASKVFKDQSGNSIMVWSNGTSNMDRPVVIVEGFDVHNSLQPPMYYSMGLKFIEKLKLFGSDVAIINFIEGGADISQNAEVTKSAINYIRSMQQGSEKIRLVGFSMGGVVGRYCLAKAEQDNNPLPVSHFVSMDAPQQYATIDNNLLDLMKQYNASASLQKIAAQQLLIYHPYDPNTNTYNSVHNSFYRTLNTLNGNGYPHLCRNIGVTFSNNSPNPNMGRWLQLQGADSFSDWLMRVLDYKKDFYLENANPEIKFAGSLLPLDLTKRTGSVLESGVTVYYALGRFADPTFIPYASALDIQPNGISKFDICISANKAYYHNEFPSEILDQLMASIGLALPLNANISGSGTLFTNLPAYFSCTVSGGTSPFRYTWQVYKFNMTRALPGNTWVDLGVTTKDITIAPPNNGDYRDFKLRCIVTDAENKSVTTNEIYCTYYTPSGNQAFTDNDKVMQAIEIESTELLNAYPNPFNPVTQIRYQLKENMYVELSVINSLGQQVGKLVSGYQEAGNYSVPFDGSKLASGVYFYRLQAGNQVFTKKMILTK